MENKKEGKGLVPVIVILTILLVCALGSTAYFYLKSNENAGKETVVTKNDKTDVNASGVKNVVSPFDNKKALNSEISEYLISDYNSSTMMASVDSTQKN